MKIEQYLYAGTSGKQERVGKAYKDRLFEGYSDPAHFEAVLSLKIQREIARWILSEECFDIVQKTDAETGHKKYVVTRARNPTDEELDDCLSQQEGVYTEPGTDDDDEAIERAAEYQARKLWQSLDGAKRSVRRLLLACFLCNVWDMMALLGSGLAECKQAQLYNERKAVLDLFDALDWGPGCLGAGQRAYMTRRLIPHLKKICVEWLEAVENQKVRLFIETAGLDARH